MLETLANRIDRLNSAIGQTAAWLTIGIVFVAFAVVLMRYGFNAGSIWLQESILYGHAAIFMLAAAWTLAANGHVRVDIFYAKASPRTKAVIDIVGTLVLLLPLSVALLWLSMPYVVRSWAILEGSREASGLPGVFLLKTLIPIFAILMALQGIAQLARAAIVLRQRRS